MYYSQKIYSKALESHLQALTIYQEIYGDNDPNTIATAKAIEKIRSEINTSK